MLEFGSWLVRVGLQIGVQVILSVGIWAEVTATVASQLISLLSLTLPTIGLWP